MQTIEWLCPHFWRTRGPDVKVPRLDNLVGIGAKVKSPHQPDQSGAKRAKRGRGRELAAGVQRGAESASAELYEFLGRRLRPKIARYVSPDHAEDCFHDVFVIVIQAIREGGLHDPKQLIGFAKTVTFRKVVQDMNEVDQIQQAHEDLATAMYMPDQRLCPEEMVEGKQEINLARKAFKELSPRDREILSRFYLQEQSLSRVCAEMNLTVGQFRVLKWRAKARFVKIGKTLLLGRL